MRTTHFLTLEKAGAGRGQLTDKINLRSVLLPEIATASAIMLSVTQNHGWEPVGMRLSRELAGWAWSCKSEKAIEPDASRGKFQQKIAERHLPRASKTCLKHCIPYGYPFFSTSKTNMNDASDRRYRSTQYSQTP